jgi:hypothetical protein
MARATNWVKLNLFLSSYFPLWIILLLMHVVAHQTELHLLKALSDPTAYVNSFTYANIIGYLNSNIANLIIIAILLGLILYPLRRVQIYMKEILLEESTEKITIQSKEELTSEYLLYVITYIFPFMTATSFDVLNGIALGGALLTIMVLYIRANLFHVNPTMLLLYNYRLYKIIDEKGNMRHLLSREETLLKNARINVHSLNGIFYVEKPFQRQGSATLVGA